MWLDALDGGPGLRPIILFIGGRTICVLAIATDTAVNAGVRLVLRYHGDDLTAALELDGPRRLTK